MTGLFCRSGGVGFMVGMPNGHGFGCGGNGGHADHMSGYGFSQATGGGFGDETTGNGNGSGEGGGLFLENGDGSGLPMSLDNEAALIANLKLTNVEI